MSYIPFTEQQREQARRTDLAAFLRQCGEEVIRVFNKTLKSVLLCRRIAASGHCR